MSVSRRCEECGKVKRCRMHVVGENKTIAYVCAPCARRLGYTKHTAERKE